MSEESEGGEKSVPYERFSAVVAAKKQLQSEFDAHRTEAASWKAAADSAATHQASAAEWQGKHDAMAGQFGRYKDLTAAGITDPDVAEVAEWTYGRLPAEGRPAFGDAIKAWKAEPDKAPAAMRPFLTAAVTPANGANGHAAPPNGTRAAPAGPAGGAQFDGPGIMRMDTDGYKANREAILKGLRGV